MAANEGLAVAGRALFAAFCVEELGSSENRCRFGFPLAAGAPNAHFPSTLAQLFGCALPGGGLPEGGLPEGGLPEGSLPEGGLPGGCLPEGGLPEGSLLSVDKGLPIGKTLVSAGGADWSLGSGVLTEGTCFGSSVKDSVPIGLVLT